MLQNCHMLAGKIWEAIDVKHMLLAEGSVLQLLQQPVHLIPGVAFTPAAQAVVALHQKGKLLQLLRQGALRLGGGVLQIPRADAAALEFVHCINELR